MLELQKIRKDINWLLEQIKCLMKKSDLKSPLAATEWSPNHSVVLGNPYILGCFVWLNGHVYESLIDDNTYPPTNDCYWTDLGEGHLLLEEQSNWNATTGRAFIKNKPTNTSDFNNDGEDGSSPFATIDDLNNTIPVAQDLDSVLTEGDIAADKQVNVESIGLWDSYAPPFGFARIFANKSRIWFQDKTGTLIAYIRANMLAFRIGVYEYTLSIPNITGNRTATFQNASGVVAYLSDIPTATPSDLVATIWSPYHTAGTGNPYLTGTRVFYNGHVYQALHDNDGIVPTNVTYWLDLGAGYLLDQELTPILAPFTLDETLQEGNTSQRDANIGVLGLWQSDVDNGDGTFGSYGYISLYSDPAAPTISYAYIRGGGLDTPVLFQTSDNGLVHFKNGHHNPTFDFSAITDTRTWNWRDMDGVVAFLSDITAQVNSDWNATSGVAKILNKPTIPAVQVQSDWNAVTGLGAILNKPAIPSIAGLVPYSIYGTYNVAVNNLFESYNNIVAGSPLVILTVNSAKNQYITGGTANQTIQLPNATTLPVGATFTFNNNSNYIVTVNNGAVSPFAVATINSGGFIVVTLLDNTTQAGSWDKHAQAPANVNWSTNTFNYIGSFTGGTWNGNPVTDAYIASAAIWNAKADDATFLYNKFMTNHFSYMLPGENSTYSLLRTNTTAGYITAGTVATLSQLPMGISYTTGIATSSIAAVFGQPMRIQLSNAQDFTFQRKWKVQITSAVQRYFVGITNKYISATPVNADQTLFLNVLGVVKLDTSSNWFFIFNDGAGVATTIDCGANFPATNAYSYNLKIQKVKGATSLTMTLTRIDNTTGATLDIVQVVNSTDYNTGVEYNPAIWVSNHTAPSGSQFYDYGCMLFKSTI